MTLFPSLSQLISREVIPDDIEILAEVGENIEQVLDTLLANIRYKDLVIQQSPDGDVKTYALTIVSKEIGFKFPGADISFQVFPGASGSGMANIAVEFEWRWGLKRYIRHIEAATFSPSPQAIFNLFLRAANVSEVEFLDAVITVFFGQGAGSHHLITRIRNAVQAFSDGDISISDPDGELIDNAADVILSLATLIAELSDPATAPEDPIAYIVEHFSEMSEQLDIDLDLAPLIFEALTHAMTDPEQKLRAIRALFDRWFSGLSSAHFEDILVPQVSLTIVQLPMALEFPLKWLVPIDANEERIANKKSTLTFGAGSLSYSTRNGIKFTAENSFDFTRSAIGQTGLTLEITGGRVDFSRTTNIPEADAAGYPTEFVGVYVQYLEIGLPAKWFAKDPNASPTATLGIVGRNLLIGTGGISGRVGLEALAVGLPNPQMTAPAAGSELVFILGRKDGGASRKGFKLGFSSFDMKFQQNVLLESKIKGSLTIPKFDADGKPPIQIELFIAQDGDFKVSASVASGYELKAGDVFSFFISKLSVEKDDDTVYIETAGKLSFENNPVIGSFFSEPLEITKLRIGTDGSFVIEGGTIPLPQSVEIKLGPAKIAITAIHCGAHEQQHGGELRKYRYWGLDAGISVNPGGIDARGDGIKYYYTVDDGPGKDHHGFLRIEGIGVDLVIPGTASKDQAVLLIKGYLALRDPEYMGSLSFQLPKAKIAGGASMRYNTQTPAWLLDIWLELSNPIPLGSTGLGIYGFRGMFGMRYVASKAAVPALTDDSSWGDYYRAPDKGLNYEKFLTPEVTAGAKNPFSIGAGVSLATAQDGGKAFTSQLFLLISIPNLILLEGRADVLAKQRVGLTDEDPPFYAYLALSPDSVEIGAGVAYKIPRDTGKVLDLNAVFEAAFFFKNRNAWYINFGTKPKPITARIIDLFDAYAYLSLSASGIETGAGVHFEFSKKYGPVAVSAEAYLDTWVYISFVKQQAGGGIALGGHVMASLFGCSLYISLEAGLSVEVPKPFRVAGYAEICVSVNLLVKKYEKCFNLEFVWEKSNEVDLDPINVLPVLGAEEPPCVAVHMQSGKTYALEYSSDSEAVATTFLPLDTYIDVKFSKPVRPGPGTAQMIGGFTNPPIDNIEYLPPRHGSRTVTHSYVLDEVKLEVKSTSNSWINYHPFEALSPDSVLDSELDLASLPVGSWQKQDPGYSQIRFLAVSPFNYMEPVGGYQPEESGITAQTLFCQGVAREEKCLAWERIEKFDAGHNHYADGVLYRVEGVTGEKKLGALFVKPGGRVVFDFVKRTKTCKIEVMTTAPEVRVNFQRKTFNSGALFYQPPSYVDVIGPIVLNSALLNQPIDYDGSAGSIDRIVVEGIPAPNSIKIDQLLDAISVISDALYLPDETQIYSPCALKAIKGRSASVRDVDQAIDLKDSLMNHLMALKVEYEKYCPNPISKGNANQEGECLCGTLIHRVCWMTEEDWTYNQTIPQIAAIESNYDAMRAGLESVIAPVWCPDQQYRIKLSVSDTVTDPSGNTSVHSDIRYVHFKTGGPIGFRSLPSTNTTSEDGSSAPVSNPPLPTPQSPEKDVDPEHALKFYLDMDHSYPDPGGNLLYAKPIYFEDVKLSLYFSKPQAYHFFADWSPLTGLPDRNYSIEVRVKDPAEMTGTTGADFNSLISTSSHVGENHWFDDSHQRVPEDIQVLNGLILIGPTDSEMTAGTCLTTGGDRIVPASKSLQIVVQNLKKKKLYTAVVLNKTGIDEAEVHRYPFQTSSFSTFNEHIGSHKLSDTSTSLTLAVHKIAVDFALPSTVSSFRSEILAIVQKNTSAQSVASAYTDYFDRLLYEKFNLGSLSPAPTVEFNFVYAEPNTECLGLLIRSPEPFNDPRIPHAELISSIEVHHAGQQVQLIEMIFSNDRCQIFAMVPSGSFPTDDLKVVFKLLSWNHMNKNFEISTVVETLPFAMPGVSE